MCLQKYRMLADEYYSVEKEPQEPDSWRNRFYVRALSMSYSPSTDAALIQKFLQEAEIKRFEEVGQRIRSQRMEADERKREREVRFTDRVPPPKRLRTGVCKCIIFSISHATSSFSLLLSRGYAFPTQNTISENPDRGFQNPESLLQFRIFAAPACRWQNSSSACDP